MRLAINIDHVATLREARGGLEPDPVTAAHICELAGAEGIVCHLREDRRHINDRDLRLLRESVKTRLDLEMAATEEIVRIATETLPELATLVPERRQELTTEGGLDVRRHKNYIKDVVKGLQNHEIEVSLFIDPIPDQIEAAHFDIVVRGDIEQLSELTLSDFEATIDFDAILADTSGYVSAKIDLPPGLQMVSRRPERHQYIVRKRL